MRRTLIRYRTKPELADDNQRAVEAVFAELAQKQPRGLRYMALRAPDATFYHLVMSEPSAAPITELVAFRAFQEGVRARCVELPSPAEIAVVGEYRMIER